MSDAILDFADKLAEEVGDPNVRLVRYSGAPQSPITKNHDSLNALQAWAVSRMRFSANIGAHLRKRLYSYALHLLNIGTC